MNASITIPSRQTQAGIIPSRSDKMAIQMEYTRMRIVQVAMCLAGFIAMYRLSCEANWHLRSHQRFRESLPTLRLRLNDESKFRIAVFSDLHYGEEENGWGIDQDVKSTRVMETVLNHENPDLVVLS